MTSRSRISIIAAFLRRPETGSHGGAAAGERQ